ncbi:hypothetical protein PpBr36_05285 [Pyricularia pennisetigena]|uniref:hypothetical protein n=1 Tax=Pyricularia pennisetigena TaxID=1578925 RepID=UPI001151BF95|nr:hypothetical protein PpBr36_05285 [Pyricularia pennisetigena]TLS26623.1 hypothetical protein PpBr36_05285 [Pyricularia pennisetigena]
MPLRSIGLRAYQSVQIISSRRWASTLGASKSRDRLSVLGNGSLTKQDALSRISAWQGAAEKDGVDSQPTNAVAILVSRDLSRWLDDSDFMSALISSLSLGSSEASQTDVNVLSAAVDSLCPQSLHGTPSSGLSILRGDQDAILPGLWQQDFETTSPTFMQRSEDARPSISMRLNPFLGDFRAVDATLPLANTVFQNARPFTLIASKWRHDSATSTAPRLVDALEKETQRIVASTGSIQSHANISVPIFPLTAPRRIASGLGNIVRQIEVGDAPVPASEELETAMHALIDARERLLPEAGPTSNRTWALVVPENSASLEFLKGFSTSVGEAGVKSEQERAETFARHFSSILEEGGRLHRVLSGGGGWGAKRGLLSLDPQTTYSSSGPEDLETFMAAFGGETTPNSVVSPGSYIQFLVEPLQPSPAQGTQRLPSLLLGTTPSNPVELGDGENSRGKQPPNLVEGHFGALSNSGIYLSLASSSNSGSYPGQILTKVDAPNSYLWEGSSRFCGICRFSQGPHNGVYSAMSFGYSVGDLIAGANMTHKLVRLMSGTSGASVEYQEAMAELCAMQDAFIQISKMHRVSDVRIFPQATVNAVSVIVI